MSINDKSISYFLSVRIYIIDFLCLWAFVSRYFRKMHEGFETRRHKGTKTLSKNQCMIITAKGFANILPNPIIIIYDKLITKSSN